MTSRHLGLFRQEALDYRRDTWLGEILLARPISFAVMAAFFMVIAALVVAYLIVGEYTKKARVAGYVVPDQGLLKIYPQEAGVVVSVAVAEGQLVKKGELLAVVSIERVSESGTTQSDIAKQLALRRASLLGEREKVQRLHEGQIAAARTRLDFLQREIEHMGRSIESQQQRVRLSEGVVERNNRLLQENFVSDAAYQERRAELLEQHNRLRELVRGKMALERDSTSLQAEVLAFPLRSQNEIAGLDRAVAEVTITSAENEARRSLYVLAPQDGIATALQLSPGKQAILAQPLMSLIPYGAQLHADLYVPSRSVGFIRVGQVAQLQYQAFPYQKFGVYSGRVVKVSRTTVPASELPFPMATSEAYYVVTVLPERGNVVAYGRAEPLRVGMQVDADIWLDRRTLLEWIFEPLYSVSVRI